MAPGWLRWQPGTGRAKVPDTRRHASRVRIRSAATPRFLTRTFQLKTYRSVATPGTTRCAQQHQMRTSGPCSRVTPPGRRRTAVRSRRATHAVHKREHCTASPRRHPPRRAPRPSCAPLRSIEGRQGAGARLKRALLVGSEMAPSCARGGAPRASTRMSCPHPHCAARAWTARRLDGSPTSSVPFEHTLPARVQRCTRIEAVGSPQRGVCCVPALPGAGARARLRQTSAARDYCSPMLSRPGKRRVIVPIGKLSVHLPSHTETWSA